MLMALNDNSRFLICEKAVAALRKGGMVVYPSDTVYGLAVDATNPMAIQKLDHFKSRQASQKFSYNFADLEMVEEFCEPSESQIKVLRRYLPGPYTFVLSDKISVRIPKRSVITEICQLFGKPVTATSANLTGKPPATRIKTLDAKIYLAANLIIEEPDFQPSQPSTVVDISREPYKVLRRGPLPFPR